MAKPKTYEQLKSEWYAKLKKKGFNDIEDNQGRLKEYHSHKFLKNASHHSLEEYKMMSSASIKHISNAYRESKEQYYYMAEHFFNSHKFESKLDAAVWELHSQGFTNNTIPIVIAHAHKSMTRRKVQVIVTRLRAIMLGGL